MIREKKCFCLFWLILIIPAIYAQDPGKEELNLPSWLLLEKGKAHYRQNDLGKSMFYFRLIQQREEDLPEAEMWLGRVYEAEGEIDLALLQYEKCLKQRERLRIEDDWIKVAYWLVDLYRIQSHYKKMEEYLKQIASADTFFYGERYRSIEQGLMKFLNDPEGINQILYLYRVPYSFSISAHQQLGVYYYYTEDYYLSFRHLVYSFLSAFSLALNEIRQYDPDFQFSSLNQTFDFLFTYKALESFITENDIYKNLYYLAASWYALKFAEYHAFDYFPRLAAFLNYQQADIRIFLNKRNLIFKILKDITSAGKWADLAKQQYYKPFIDNLTVFDY